MKAIVSNTQLPAEDPFWVQVAFLLIGILRERRTPLDLGPLSPQALADAVMSVL